MGFLSTHVLDTALGRPASGMAIDLYAVSGTERQYIKSLTTNSDGRCDEHVLCDQEFKTGVWELVFHVAGYFSGKDVILPQPPFLDEVTVRFGISGEEDHYHVPLLVSPWSYSTYRGS